MSILDLNTVFANMSVENDQSENNNNSDQIKNKSSLRHLTSPCYLRAADTTFENSVLLASHQAYHAFWSRICHAILHYTQKIEIDSTQYFYAGKFRWHWSVFVHGIRKNGKRDRSIWARHSICTPFEQLRRDFAKQGYYLVLAYKEGERVPECRVFTKNELVGPNAEKNHIEETMDGERVWNPPGCGGLQFHKMNLIPY